MYATELLTTLHFLCKQIKIKLHCTLPIIQLSILSRGSLSENSIICDVASAIFLLQATAASYLSPASDILGCGSFFSDFSELAVSSAFILNVLYLSAKTSFGYF